MEYIWQLLEPKSDALMTSIIDLTGLSFSVIRKRELIMFIKIFCSTMGSHFPQRAHRTLLINSPKVNIAFTRLNRNHMPNSHLCSPKWFNALYKLLSQILRESTRTKITILSKGEGQDKVLESLCPGYNAESNQPLHDMMDTQTEVAFRGFVSQIFSTPYVFQENHCL